MPSPKPPVDRSVQRTRPITPNAMPPTIRNEHGIAGSEHRLLHIQLSILIPISISISNTIVPPNSPLQGHHLPPAHHLRAPEPRIPLRSQLPPDALIQHLALPGRQETHPLLAEQLAEQIRIRVAVQRRVRGLEAQPHARVVDVALAGAAYERRRRQVLGRQVAGEAAQRRLRDVEALEALAGIRAARGVELAGAREEAQRGVELAELLLLQVRWVRRRGGRVLGEGGRVRERRDQRHQRQVRFVAVGDEPGPELRQRAPEGGVLARHCCCRGRRVRQLVGEDGLAVLREPWREGVVGAVGAARLEPFRHRGELVGISHHERERRVEGLEPEYEEVYCAFCRTDLGDFVRRLSAAMSLGGFISATATAAATTAITNATPRRRSGLGGIGTPEDFG